MSLGLEIADIMKKPGKMYDWSEKIYNNSKLDNEEEEICEVVDAWAKKIGKTGKDKNGDLASFLEETLSAPVYDKADALMDRMFTRNKIGEFDDFYITKDPINTLKAYDATKGGSVFRSYIDTSVLKPVWKFAAVETSIDYSDLRRDGYRSIANLTMFAKEALEDKQIQDAFSVLDDAIAGGSQVFGVTGDVSSLTLEVVDELCRYLRLHKDNQAEQSFMFGLDEYMEKVSDLVMTKNTGNTASDRMKEEYNRYGFLTDHKGALISTYPGVRYSDGQLVIPERRIFGVSGKIGTLCRRGELRVYDTPNNDLEVISLKLTGYEYGIAVTKPEKAAKITFTA